MQKLNEADKNELLAQSLKEGEEYQAKVWGVIVADGGAAGAFSNEYCYIGITENRLVFYVMKTFNCHEVKDAFELPLTQIDKVRIKGSILPGRKVVHLRCGKNNLTLSLMANAIGSDIQGQKENVDIMLNKLSSL